MSNEPENLEGLGDDARKLMHAAARQFVDHLNKIGAPNFLEILMVDESGEGQCVFSVRRVDGENPLEQLGRVKAENASLRRRLEDIEQMARRG